MGEFVMPSLGADMERGTLLEWLVHPGDTVHRGDVVAVVDTDKAAVEVEVFEDGVVQELLVGPGTQVAVGVPLARLGPAGATAPEVPEILGAREVPAIIELPEATTQPAVPAVRSPLVRHLVAELAPDEVAALPAGVVHRQDVEQARARRKAPEPPVGEPSSRRTRVSPYARRRAAELGVDLASVTTGPGPVRGAAVEAAAARGASEAPRPQEPPVSPPGRSDDDRQLALRRAIGALMSRSKHEVPHYYLAQDVDAGRAVRWLLDRNAGRPPGEQVLFAALLAAATARAVEGVAGINGTWEDDRFVPAADVRLAVPVRLRGGGLLTPVLPDAAELPVPEVMRWLRDVVRRARGGRLRAAELTGGTLTLTDLGDQGADLVHGVVYVPQVALVGAGRVRERPWAVDGMLAVRPALTLTLAGDHRASDGHDGSRYLDALDQLLQTPERWADT